jgi:hypothetical protein
MENKETILKKNNKITCWYCGTEKKVQTGICEKCGKFGKTNREIALYWWKSLEIYQQMNFANNYFTKDDSCNLTDNEIEEIYLKEHGNKEDLSIIYDIAPEARPKNKFQNFDIKKAQAYINKLSQEGKDKMIKMLGGYTIVELNNKCYDAWIDSFLLKRNTDITGFNNWQNKNLL